MSSTFHVVRHEEKEYDVWQRTTAGKEEINLYICACSDKAMADLICELLNNHVKQVKGDGND